MRQGDSDSIKSADVAVLSIILTGSTLTLIYTYKRYLTQFKRTNDIPRRIFRKQWLYGKVTSVGDGDNFHFFHMPGGMRGGWGWLRAVPQMIKNDSTAEKLAGDNGNIKFFNLNWIIHGRSSKSKIQKTKSQFLKLNVPYKNRKNLPTIPIRLCGIDAPERAHFGNPAQPFGNEALIWLQNRILGKKVWVKPLSIDQYNRCVARVSYWDWFGGWKDLSLEMLKDGLAVVYEGKVNTEFDGREDKYRYYEFLARSKKRGLWVQNKFETPGEYKKRV
ncbi:Lcl3p [Saccharomyces paradoxus]|uniref:Probable endonuclease LCL3 n=1 Tax=Saccharomyces paradoxus TaxID=27291 RepID=A0A8B8URH2_SACPA|nr:Lcl3 [Saccharomyces paradoxus]QHS73249.1 Lcl3 [Saccharomyces paradoxus]